MLISIWMIGTVYYERLLSACTALLKSHVKAHASIAATDYHRHPTYSSDNFNITFAAVMVEIDVTVTRSWSVLTLPLAGGHGPLWLCLPPPVHTVTTWEVFWGEVFLVLPDLSSPLPLPSRKNCWSRHWSWSPLSNSYATDATMYSWWLRNVAGSDLWRMKHNQMKS